MRVSKEERERKRNRAGKAGVYLDERPSNVFITPKQAEQLARDVLTLCDDADVADSHIAEFEQATCILLAHLTPYYWSDEDFELEAVNRLRRLLGIREQLAEDAGEAELQADEAERGESLFRAEHEHADALEAKDERIAELEERVRWVQWGAAEESSATENELAPALGYEYDEEYGWVTGDHTSVTLAMEARRRIAELDHNLAELMDWLVEGLDYGAGVTAAPRMPEKFRRSLAEAWHRAGANDETVEDYEEMLESEGA